MQLQAAAEHCSVGITQRYSMVQAWYSTQKPVWQVAQLGSGSQERMGTQSPQHEPTTEGTSPIGQAGVGA
jgi:hypothetical protein